MSLYFGAGDNRSNFGNEDLHLAPEIPYFLLEGQVTGFRSFAELGLLAELVDLVLICFENETNFASNLALL